MSTSLKAPQTDTLRIEMIRRGLSVDGLAALSGISVESMANQLAGNFPSRRMRLVVEKVLNMPMWSGADEFNSRLEFERSAGRDLILLTVPEMKCWAKELKIPRRYKATSRSSLISLLQNHFSESVKNTQSPYRI